MAVTKVIKKKVIKKKERRYVAIRNIEKREKEGWVVVDEGLKSGDRVLGVKFYTDPDIVLMEK